MKKYLPLVAINLVAVAAPSQAQESEAITIGVIDLAPQRMHKNAYGSIESKFFTAQDARPAYETLSHGRGHSSVMVDTAITSAREQGASKINVFLASPFYQTDKSIKIDWDGAVRALKWIKENGATYVCTSFGAYKSPQIDRFVEEASSEGLTIVASLGNGDKQRVWPAMAKGVYAVIADRAFNDPQLLARADAVASGTAPLHNAIGEFQNVDDSSSVAAARVCGQLSARPKAKPIITASNAKP